MDENILKVDFGVTTSPIITEQAGRDWIEYGTEEWRNLYPQFLIDLYYNSSTQAAIVNATSEMIAGEDIIIEDEDELQDDNLKADLNRFLKNANGSETLMEVIKKVAFDFKLQGAFALNIIWSQDRTKIAEIYHIPVEKLRCSKPNEMGKVEGYWISGDWSNTRKSKPEYVPAFNVNDRTSPNQIIYSGLYSPNMSVYHTPDYVAANNWALVDQRVAEFHLNNISNGFAGSYFISFANGVPTQEERGVIENSIAEKFAGAHNAGKFVMTFSDDKTRTPEITPITVSNADQQYLALQELLVQNILTGHRCTSPVLMGIKSDTGLGNNAEELNSAANYYLNTVVKPFQDHILKVIDKILDVNQISSQLAFVQLKPITLRFTDQDLAAVMTQDEIREELGLAPLDENINVDVKAQKDFTKFAQSKKLKSFLETIPDIPKEWKLIKEEVVDGEHRDFDYEAELNKTADEINNVELEKQNLVSSGRANPNARDPQDGLNRTGTAFYKVRYVYANDNFLYNASGTSRDFCNTMTWANKIYRKRDIEKMGSMGVNAGFGPHGARNYDIFLYKGGPQCHHFWLRQIYKAPASDNDYVYYPDDVRDEKNIGYTQAVMEGFVAERNDGLVAIPPKRMANNGYLK
tara:strand:- start:21 stop:1922 length:1902 start_codon:yes stop_codon:yes gene_type:complete